MSQCESTYNGFKCQSEADHVIHSYTTQHMDIRWKDEQADESEWTKIDPPGHEEYVKQLDPILTKTGKTREWWRYHYAGLVMQSNLSKGWAARRADCVLHADALLEELEK